MPFLLALMGPTASGKSELAEELAERNGAELLNADAFQVYRGLDIGTGKSPHASRYQLLNIVDPWEQFGLGAWLQLASESLRAVWGREKSAIVVGGTGLYIRALFEGYDAVASAPDPALRAQLAADAAQLGNEAMLRRLQQLDPAGSSRVDADNPRRVLRALERALSPTPASKIALPPFNRLKFAIDPPPKVLAERIEKRVAKMLANGWIEEVRRLMATPNMSIDSPGMKAIGYRFLWEQLEGKMTEAEARERIVIATRQYAKRQRTWLRSEPGLERLPWGEENLATLSRRLTQ